MAKKKKGRAGREERLAKKKAGRVGREERIAEKKTGRVGREERIAELALLSEEIAGRPGRLLHLLYLDLLKPGAGLWLQTSPKDGEPEEDSTPPWPEPGKTDPLEEPFGGDADGIRLLTEDEFNELAKGGNPKGSKPAPKLKDRGSIGGSEPNTPSYDWTSRHTFRMSDGRWSRGGRGQLPPCGGLWILELDYFERVPTCDGIDYTGPYRATLLRAIAEAYRHCRRHDKKCPNARVWLLRAVWFCMPDHKGGPVLDVAFKLAVACVAA